ncbi:hypothetical protein [Streptomyces sp. NPDC051183]|uniref:hypothetical protein n=1 Tax=Streptomyces sp. NPDC051183 TaxID=3155165 RepID=UPI00343663A3
MQLRRAVPLSLVALLASAGCVSVGPQSQSPAAPARGPVPRSGSAEAPAREDAPAALPLGRLPAAPAAAESGAEPEADAPAARAPRPRAGRPAKPAAPRRAHPPEAPPARPGRPPAPPPRGDELCAAAEGAVPPSIVDLCIRQFGR